MSNVSLAEQIAANTDDAYSYELYGHGMWVANIQSLLDAGYGVRQTEAIVRSKYARWARDLANDVVSSRTILEHRDNPRNIKLWTSAAIQSLVEETFA